MSSQAETIENLRTILKRAKNELYDKDGKLDRRLYSEIAIALNEIQEQNLIMLTKEIYDLLECPLVGIKTDVIATLGYTTRLHVPEFRDKAYEIFLNDPDESVKSTALRAWTGYYFESNDKKVLKILYGILLDDNQPNFVRSSAYYGIYTTISDLFTSSNSINTTALIKSETAEEFNMHVNWEEVKNIMLKYAPEILLDLGVKK